MLLLAPAILWGVGLCDAVVWQGDGEPGEDCVMGGGVVGRCEEVRACLEDGGVVRREGVVELCRPHLGTIYVCCRKPHLVARELCDAWSGYLRQQDGSCVIEKPLIIGGVAANLGEFPHTALVGTKLPNKAVRYDCGGTLISPHYVLTAAHCLLRGRHVLKGLALWVKLGEHDRLLNSSDTLIEVLKGPVPDSLYQAASLQESGPAGGAGGGGTGGGGAGGGDPVAARSDASPAAGAESPDPVELIPVEQEIEVERKEIYPEYPSVYNYHDIALLKLKTPAKLTRRVMPACLPHDPYDDHTTDLLTVVGWGHTRGLQQMSRMLQKAQVPVMDRLRCSTIINNPYNVPVGITHDLLCAGKNNSDSCQGDSGGPLTKQVPREGSVCEHTVVGVVGFGVGYNSPCGLMGVYARVSSYLDWITGFIAPNAVAYTPTTTMTTTTTTTTVATATTSARDESGFEDLIANLQFLFPSK